MGKKMIQFATGLDEEQTKKILLVFLAISIFVLSMIFQIVYEQAKNKKIRNPNLVSPGMRREMIRMTNGYPIFGMLPYISQKDKRVAAYLISISKKESNWGVHVPVRNGKDCYNYWGFRMETNYMGSSGHTCFRNPKQAVDIVSNRLNELVYVEKKDTPKKMSIWKCGSACASDRQVGKWISDVSFYYNKLINL